MSETVSILGHRVLRVEDPRFLTGAAVYGADVGAPPDCAHVVFVRSVDASAAIASVDVSEALEAPGVLGVFTADDLDIGPVPPAFPMIPVSMSRPLLADRFVRFMGEPIAAIVAKSVAEALDAAEKVVVETEPTTVLVNPHAALRADAPRIFLEAPSNVAFALPAEPIDFSGCDVVVELEMVNQRLSGAPIEPRASLAYWTDEGLVQHVCSQGVHGVRDALASVYGLKADQVRVINADVGGAFGVRGRTTAEELLLGWLANRIGRPVRWVESRSECMAAMGHGRGQHQRVTLGGTADGLLTHYRLHIVQEAGAYPSIGAILPMATKIMGAGSYAIPNIEIAFQSVVTNTATIVAYRGAGRPEATSAIERAVDVFASRVGKDPAEIRRQNVIADDAFPYANGMGVTYDVGRYATALDMALAAFGYESRRSEQRATRESGSTTALGIGIATYVEITGGPSGGSEFSRVVVQPDATVDVYTGSTPTGQGHETAWAMIAAARLQVPVDRVRVHHGDTAVIATSTVTGGSRSVQIAGSGVSDAATRVARAAADVAATLLEADPRAIVPSTDGFFVNGSPTRSVSWAAVAAADPTALTRDADVSQAGPTFPYGTHVAAVEIDIETGGVQLIDLVACDDAGTIINPMLAEGQLHGGMGQGVAQALFEGIVYDENGTLRTSTLLDYLVPSAADVPAFITVHLETPTPLNPLGAKGIGESGTIGATAAVHNAVLDALRPFGVTHLDMPLSPEKIWRAIHAAKQ